MANVDQLNPELRARVQALIAASGGRITIKSGFRTVERQRQLWKDAVEKYGSEAAARKWVAKPGSSNHNKGEAVDLGGDLVLARKLAPQFNLSFPMSWEPWHVQRAEFKSKAGSLTAKPVATAPGAAPAAPTPTTTTASTATPAPGEDRKDLGVQLATLLTILDKPLEEVT